MKARLIGMLVLIVLAGVAVLALVNRMGGGPDAPSAAAPMSALPPEPMTPRLDASGFNAGNIISDEVFYDADAMSDAEIAAFIADVNDGCRTGRDGTVCLGEYRENTPTFAADQYCDGLAGGTDVTAAQIIGDVARSCNVNPQALLVMLQKEQGLLTSSGRRLEESRYTIAMGYGCPDTSNCDPQYFGFANQVYHAARQFQVYRANPDRYSIVPFAENNIGYHPNPECGSSTVYVENYATAGLYNYTPYQPNLEAPSEDCSSVGNINFYAYFAAWFR